MPHHMTDAQAGRDNCMEQQTPTETETPLERRVREEAEGDTRRAFAVMEAIERVFGPLNMPAGQAPIRISER